MRLHLLAFAAMFAAVPGSAQDMALGITLIHGHPIHHESEKEAGVSMGLSITGDQEYAAPLVELCNELRVSAGLGHENKDGFNLEAVFVVPYKRMAVEGYYLLNDGDFDTYSLIPGNNTARESLNGILARAGIPPDILDQTDVEHEISCRPGEPLWTVAWHDVRPIGEEEPEAVIERARRRFMTIYQSVVERAAGKKVPPKITTISR